MGAGLLAVKSGFILFIEIYQVLHNKHASDKEREGKKKQQLVIYFLFFRFFANSLAAQIAVWRPLTSERQHSSSNLLCVIRDG
jgi:hypothetical protein